MSSLLLKKIQEGKYLTFVLGPREGKPAEPVVRELNPEDYVGELYHPGKPDTAAYQPGNELANEYTALRVLWTNFSTFFEQARQNSDPFSRKLTLKSAAIELRSFIDAQPRLNTLIAKVPCHDGKFPRSFVCLTAEEREQFEKKSKALGKAKNHFFNTLTKLRNGIGAHMNRPLLKGGESTKPKEELSWKELEHLWDLLEPRMFLDITQAIDAYLACVRTLPVFEFYRFEAPNRLRIHVPAIVQEHGLELRLPALSASLIKQIEQVDADAVEGTYIVLQREPLCFRARWPGAIVE